jgi:phosphatidylglycerophosphate synthase
MTFVMTLPNLLSCSRYFLALPMAYLTWSEEWQFAVLILCIAIATDFADGHIARLRNQTSALGGLLDHSSDAFFIASLLLALSLHGWIPAILPILVVLAFLQYTFDSKALSGQPLRTSSLGRYNGIAYFVMGGIPVMQNAIQFEMIPYVYIPWLAWGLVITTIISMLDRLITLLTKSDTTLDE